MNLRSPKHDPYIGLKSGGRPRVFASSSARQTAYDLYYTDKLTYEAIGEEFNTSKVVVKNLFKIMGWPARDRSAARRTNGRLDPERMEKYERLYLAGWTIEQIASKYKFAPRWLSSHLRTQRLLESRSQIARRNVRINLGRVHTQQAMRALASPYREMATKAEFYRCVAYLTGLVKPLIEVPTFSRNDIGDRAPQLDHQLSVADAYYTPRSKPLTVYEVAHPVNLQYLTPGQNVTKGDKSNLTDKELRRRIRAYNRCYGDPFGSLVVKSNSPLYSRNSP